MERKNPLHPYLPATLLLPNFTENSLRLEALLGIFGAIIVVISGGTWKLTSKWRPHFTWTTKAKICWFCVSGLIHLLVEGYFVSYYQTFSGSNFFMAQIWKEYAKGDSRYISSDAFTVVMETFTAIVDGPLCFWTIYAYMKDRPYLHVLQLLVSVAQFYGDLLYMLTAWFEEFKHGPPFHPVYFWGYFVFMNSFWLIIPALLISDSAVQITRSFTLAKNFRSVISDGKWEKAR